MSSVALILIGGPSKGTRFRPLSFKTPKPLFPLAEHETVFYHIKACEDFNNSDSFGKNEEDGRIRAVFLVGSYQSSDAQIVKFLKSCQSNFSLPVSYLQEYEKNLGTAGALYHFRDLYSTSKQIFVFNGDVLCHFPLQEMFFQKTRSNFSNIMLCHKSTSKKATLGNCIVEEASNKIIHFVEKPTDLLPTHISCGVYLLETEAFLAIAKRAKQQLLGSSHHHQYQDDNQIFNSYNNNNSNSSKENSTLSLEKHIFPSLVDDSSLGAVTLDETRSSINWVQIKTAHTALTANKFVLQTYPNNVYVHPSTKVDPSAKIGPNVSVGEFCDIGPGVRISESIVLPNTKIGSNSCICNSIIGWNNRIGEWARIEGILPKLNADVANEVIENTTTSSGSGSFRPPDADGHFEADGTLKKLVTILGHDVVVNDEMLVYSCLILPGKTIDYKVMNQIVL